MSEPASVTASGSIRVLIAEDSRADAELNLRELKRAGLAVEHRIVDSEREFARELDEFSPDIIVSDFTMPKFDGMAALALAHEKAPDTPFIFVSGTIGEEYAIRALRNGAIDYVLKGNLLRLPAAVERALHDAKDRRARRKAEAKLAEARDRLQSIYESLPDMLWSVELPSQRIIYVSPAARVIYGHEPSAFLENSSLWIDVVHPQGNHYHIGILYSAAYYITVYATGQPHGVMSVISWLPFCKISHFMLNDQHIKWLGWFRRHF